MTVHIKPKFGQWYYDTIEDRQFEVLYADEDEDLIEIHYKEGQTEELDYASWTEKELRLISAPDDWDNYEEGKEEDELDDDDDEDWSSFSEIDPDEDGKHRWEDDDKEP